MRLVVVRSPCRRAGFTLIEIIVSCAIIIALGAAAFLGAGTALDSGRYHTARTGTSAIAMALVQYKFEIGVLPTTDQGLGRLTESVNGKGPWVSSESLVDPWGNDYHYNVNGRSYAVWSYGKDGNNNSGAMPETIQGDDVGIVGYVSD